MIESLAGMLFWLTDRRVKDEPVHDERREERIAEKKACKKLTPASAQAKVNESLDRLNDALARKIGNRDG